MTPDEAPMLRTLAPLLRGLEHHLRGWLNARHAYPVSFIHRAELEGLADDLNRKAESMDVDRPLLIIILMGGTGVGKSTLLNALAGGAVAQASFTRPTTRDPVVYFHQSISPERLDPALRLCRLARHDQSALSQKVIVDTPDLDSNDIANREKLLSLLPVADVVLYVGSQEKYHDQIGWTIFKEQRRRRAFAFVLNKWDRCLVDGAKGLRPDEDLLNDLKSEGFESPRLFRTTAQVWLDAELQRRAPDPVDLPPGEQFTELKSWLELGLTRLEIESVKARGVGQLLEHVEKAIENLRPPDLSLAAEKVKKSWEEVLAQESQVGAEVLVGSLDPHRGEIEHHFTVRGQQRFRGLFAGYLRLTTKMRYFGNSLQPRIPFGSRAAKKGETATSDWSEIAAFAQDCARSAGERVLDQRSQALVNRLLIEADQVGFPLSLLNEPTTEVSKLDWDDRFGRDVVESLENVEAEYTVATGWRAYLRGAVGFLANTLPEVMMVGSIIVLLFMWIGLATVPTLAQMLMPLYVLIGTLILMHLLVTIVFPVRWSAIREEFHNRLEEKLHGEYRRAYLPVPAEVAATIRAERKQVDALLEETREMSEWLRQKESLTKINELYGSQ